MWLPAIALMRGVQASTPLQGTPDGEGGLTSKQRLAYFLIGLAALVLTTHFHHRYRMPSPRRGDAEARYGLVRRGIYAILERQLRPIVPGIQVTGITGAALRRWRETWVATHDADPRETGDWDWEALRQEFADARRFDVALWDGETLCGLILGKVSNGRNHVSIYYIESYKGDHSLRGRMLEIADIAGTAFAIEIRARRVRIVNPATGLVKDYIELGYVEVPGCVPPCMEKGVFK